MAADTLTACAEKISRCSRVRCRSATCTMRSAPSVPIKPRFVTSSARPPCLTKPAAAFGTKSWCTSSSSCCNPKCVLLKHARSLARICVELSLVKESRVAVGNGSLDFPLQAADGFREIFDRYSRVQRERAHRRYARQGAGVHRRGGGGRG